MALLETIPEICTKIARQMDAAARQSWGGPSNEAVADEAGSRHPAPQSVSHFEWVNTGMNWNSMKSETDTYPRYAGDLENDWTRLGTATNCQRHPVEE